MRAARTICAAACLLAAAALVAGCGGGSDSTGPTKTSAATAGSRPAPATGEFPSAAGKTLREVIKDSSDGPAEVTVEPAAMVFYPGRNRYPFEVSERDGTPIPDAEVALYFSPVPAPKPGAKSKRGNRGPAAKAQLQALDQPAVGPFPAEIESLATKPAYRSQNTLEDPDSATVVYSTELDFPSEGEWRVGALVKQDGELKGTILPTVKVGEFHQVPRPGQPAPLIHTPTAAEAGGDLAEITTRVPPDSQNKVDYADVLGKKPIVLLFASPRFCQSRVCGPVVDVAEQVKAETGDKAAFIHMETYNDNDPAKGARPQVRRFHLPSEPWLFTLNRHGDVSSAIEGGLGLRRMRAAVEKAVAE